ncbi:MAG: hypothetical protein EXR48_04465 [Dehalococcoidia bacterium]|nr:hypothetical protein [Dehalococcoidia bacterium]
MQAWIARYRAQKKMEHVWSFAGLPGGAGLLNVNSLEELDAILSEFPFGPFSDIKIYPITELDGSLQRVKQAMQQASGGAGATPQKVAARSAARRPSAFPSGPGGAILSAGSLRLTWCMLR